MSSSARKQTLWTVPIKLEHVPKPKSRLMNPNHHVVYSASSVAAAQAGRATCPYYAIYGSTETLILRCILSGSCLPRPPRGIVSLPGSTSGPAYAPPMPGSGSPGRGGMSWTGQERQRAADS